MTTRGIFVGGLLLHNSVQQRSWAHNHTKCSCKKTCNKHVVKWHR